MDWPCHSQVQLTSARTDPVLRDDEGRSASPWRAKETIQRQQRPVWRNFTLHEATWSTSYWTGTARGNPCRKELHIIKRNSAVSQKQSNSTLRKERKKLHYQKPPPLFPAHTAPKYVDCGLISTASWRPRSRQRGQSSLIRVTADNLYTVASVCFCWACHPVCLYLFMYIERNMFMSYVFTHQAF